jgi:hypothetical protein
VRFGVVTAVTRTVSVTILGNVAPDVWEELAASVLGVGKRSLCTRQP